MTLEAPHQPERRNRRASDAVREETQRISRTGTWHQSGDSDLMIWSDQMYAIYGVTRDTFEPTYANVLARIHPDDRHRVLEANAAAQAGALFDVEHRIHLDDGAQRYVHGIAQVVTRPELGSVPILIGTARDVTERRNADETIATLQRELIHLSRRSAMGTMAATLAHELNQPLTAISNYAAALAKTADADPSNPRLAIGLREIQTNALRAGEIMRRMRDMAQKRAAKRERICLTHGASEATHAANLRADGVVFKFDMRDTNVVIGDRVQIEQVLVNLVRNACEALEGAGERVVTISSRDIDDGVEVTVADTGPGIPDKMLSALFSPQISTKPDGMGVGLSVCRTIVEAHGGTIAAAAAARGARLTFTIPAVAAEG